MKKTFIRAVALTAALSLVTMNVAFAGGSIGHGNISVYKDNTLVSKLSGQNPIEDGALLVCDGKCMLKSEGISLIAADKSTIAVDNETDTFRLYVKEGTVDYVINSNARKIEFYTPQGSYTVAEVVYNASSSPVVKGSVVVDSDGATEISVTEGRMVFATSEGMKTVDANHKIVLAQAPASAGGSSVAPWIIGAAALGGAILIIDDQNDDDPVVSLPPPQPPPPPKKKPSRSPSS